MNILISVIIPHYNSKGLLRRTLDSIPRRDDIQIIVVDDLSTESSIQEIASEAEYAHVTFEFSNKKLTAGGARNVGILLAIGEYVLFSDSDDYFSETAFNYFIEIIESRKDLYQFHVTSFIEGSNKEGTRHLYLLPFYKLANHVALLGIVGPVAKLIRLEFLKMHNILFSEVPAGNDVVFSTKVSCAVKSFEFVNNVVYHISQNSSGLTSTISLENSLARVREAIKRTKIIKESKVVSQVVYFSKANQILEFTKILVKLKHKKYAKLYFRYLFCLPPFTIVAWVLRAGIEYILKKRITPIP